MTEQTILFTPPQVAQQLQASPSFLGTDLSQITVVSQEGESTPFDTAKILGTLKQIFESHYATQNLSRFETRLQTLHEQIQKTLLDRMQDHRTIHTEDIQDQIELALIRGKEIGAAEAFAQYRESRRKAREFAATQAQQAHYTSDNSYFPILKEVCDGLSEADQNSLIALAEQHPSFQQAPIRALVDAALELCQQAPQYEFTATRISLLSLCSESLTYLGLGTKASKEEMQSLYPIYFSTYLNKGVGLGLLDPRLLTLDSDRLAASLKPARDDALTYQGFILLKNHFLLKHEDCCFELPQAFFMRVAMALALEAPNPTEKALAYYELLSQQNFFPAANVLLNAGKLGKSLVSLHHEELSAELHQQLDLLKKQALLNQQGSALSIDWQKSSASQSPALFASFEGVSQLSSCAGGLHNTAVLPLWHLATESLLGAPVKTHHLALQVIVPDLFMRRVQTDEAWFLFESKDVSELPSINDEHFERAYLSYEEKALQGLIAGKEVSAKKLWQNVLSHIYHNPLASIQFKAPAKFDTIYGAINLATHVHAQGIDVEKLQQTIEVAVGLCHHASLNNHPSQKARSLGIGVMGFQEMLSTLGVEYSSPKAQDIASRTLELVSYFTLESLCQLSQSAPCSSESRWINSDFPNTTKQTLDWSPLKTRIANQGLPYVGVLSNVPDFLTATIAAVSVTTEPEKLETTNSDAVLSIASACQSWVDQAHHLRLKSISHEGKTLDRLCHQAWESGILSISCA